MKKQEIVVKGLFLCEYASFSRDNQLSIVGIFDRVYSSNFPTIHPQVYLVGIVQGKALAKVSLKLRLVDDTSKEIVPHATVTGELSESGKWNFVIKMPLISFPKEGTYRFQVSLGDEIFEEVGLELVSADKGEQNGQSRKLSD